MSQRYVIHLPVVATDLAAAQRLARVIGRWMRVLPMADPGRPPSPRRTGNPSATESSATCACLAAGAASCATATMAIAPAAAPLTQPDDPASQLPVVPSAVMIIRPLTCAAREVAGMVARRWDARFEEEHLVLRRWRLLPWPKAHVRRISLAAILGIWSFTTADQAKRQAQLSVQDTSAPDPIEVIPVSFTREQWKFAGWFMEERRAEERRAAPTRPPQFRGVPSPGQVALSRPAADVAALSRQQAQLATALRAHLRPGRRPPR